MKSRDNIRFYVNTFLRWLRSSSIEGRYLGSGWRFNSKNEAPHTDYACTIEERCGFTIAVFRSILKNTLGWIALYLVLAPALPYFLSLLHQLKIPPAVALRPLHGSTLSSFVRLMSFGGFFLTTIVYTRIAYASQTYAVRILLQYYATSLVICGFIVFFGVLGFYNILNLSGYPFLIAYSQTFPDAAFVFSACMCMTAFIPLSILGGKILIAKIMKHRMDKFNPKLFGPTFLTVDSDQPEISRQSPIDIHNMLDNLDALTHENIRTFSRTLINDVAHTYGKPFGVLLAVRAEDMLQDFLRAMQYALSPTKAAMLKILSNPAAFERFTGNGRGTERNIYLGRRECMDLFVNFNALSYKDQASVLLIVRFVINGLHSNHPQKTAENDEIIFKPLPSYPTYAGESLTIERFHKEMGGGRYRSPRSSELFHIEGETRPVSEDNDDDIAAIGDSGF